MEKLSYFNIGFRSESSRIALDAYANNLPFPTMLIQDAERIVGDCLRFEDPLNTPASYQPDHPDIAALTLRIFQGMSFAEIKRALFTMQSNLRKIKEGQTGVEVNPSIEFFGTLSEECLYEQHRPNSFDL